MEKDLCFKALLKFSLGVVAIGILLFLPAGTFHYWKAWLLMGILFIPMLFAGIVTVEKSGLAQKTLEHKRIASGTTSGDKLKCRNVSFGICFSRIEFPLRMDNSTRLVVMDRYRYISAFIYALCGSIKGECLLITNG